MQIPAYTGTIVDIIVTLILIFSFIGGLRGGAVKESFGLVAFIIALALNGLLTGVVSGWLSFIGDTGWRSLLAFLIAMAIIMLVFFLILWFPRHLLDKVWNGGFIWSLVGGLLSVLNFGLGMVLLMRLLSIYAVLPWLGSILASSHVLGWLVSVLDGFVASLMQATLPAGLSASISSCAV